MRTVPIASEVPTVRTPRAPTRRPEDAAAAPNLVSMEREVRAPLVAGHVERALGAVFPERAHRVLDLAALGSKADTR